MIIHRLPWAHPQPQSAPQLHSWWTMNHNTRPQLCIHTTTATAPRSQPYVQRQPPTVTRPQPHNHSHTPTATRPHHTPTPHANSRTLGKDFPRKSQIHLKAKISFISRSWSCFSLSRTGPSYFNPYSLDRLAFVPLLFVSFHEDRNVTWMLYCFLRENILYMRTEEKGDLYHKRTIINCGNIW